MQVDVRGDGKESFEVAMKEFKRRVKRENIMQDLRKHEHYVKPSMKAKLRHIEALKRQRRDAKEALKPKRYE